MPDRDEVKLSSSIGPPLRGQQMDPAFDAIAAQVPEGVDDGGGGGGGGHASAVSAGAGGVASATTVTGAGDGTVPELPQHALELVATLDARLCVVDYAGEFCEVVMKGATPLCGLQFLYAADGGQSPSAVPSSGSRHVGMWHSWPCGAPCRAVPDPF
jgi:hypothetical protein